MLSFLSFTASPTAVEVKLLLNENNECRVSAERGAHHPSAITCPCRTSMNACIASSLVSAPEMKSSNARDDTPCASGEPRGNEECVASPAPGAALIVISSNEEMAYTSDRGNPKCVGIRDF